MKKNLSECVDYILDAFKNGSPTREIAKQLGVSRTPIIRVLKENGIDPKPDIKGYLDSVKKEVIDLYLKGKSTRDLAKKYQVGYKSIAKLLRKNNIEMRAINTVEIKITNNKQEILNYYNEVKNVKDVSEKFGIKRRHISNLLKENNIEVIHKTRGTSRAKTEKDYLRTIWNGMKYRCYSKKSNRFKNYGGRGIFVCDEWKDNFSNFYYWALENDYKIGLSIERKDNNGPYSSQNCCWTSRMEQAKNMTTTKKIEYKGQTYSQRELSLKIFGKPSILGRRLREGWSLKDAIETPRLKNQFHKNDVKIT